MNEEIAALLRRLTTSTSSFREFRAKNALYVDKTEYLDKMINRCFDSAYFLSRPRRFGKSLLLSTIAELFAGNEELFRGLYIHDKWDWSQKFPVIHLNLLKEEASTLEELTEWLRGKVEECAKTVYPCEIKLRPGLDPDCALEDLIYGLYKQTKMEVVVLIDEYDIPIVNQTVSPEEARESINVIHNFYIVLKEIRRYIRFIMLTGKSETNEAGIFFALNNLLDISSEPNYSAVCGFTEAELDRYFKPFIDIIDRDKLGRIYNEYDGLEKPVYNPVDVLKAISSAVSE